MKTIVLVVMDGVGGRAHNPEVAGSNPVPAIRLMEQIILQTKAFRLDATGEEENFQ